MELHFILRNDYPNALGYRCMNEYIPAEKRIVTIELTMEQIEQIKPRMYGDVNGVGCYEEIHEIIADGYKELREG